MMSDELRDLRSDILDYMRERFDQVDARLDHINGTVRQHDTRLTTMETQCAERTCRLAPAPAPDPPGSMFREKRTWQVGGLGAGMASAMWVIMEFLRTLVGLHSPTK